MTTTIDVACFGEILWDFFEEEGEKSELRRSYRREIGGASANVAIALTRLGVRASAVGGVGDDKLGQALGRALEAEGVDTTHLARVKARTGITFVTRDASGEPAFVPYRSGSADLALDAAKVVAGSAKARFCVTSSTSMLGDARAATEKFLDAAEKAKAAIVVDLNIREHLWKDATSMREAVRELVGRAVLIKASESDLGALAGKRGMSWIDEHAKHATCILTRGENGAAALGEHGQATAPTRRVRCIDATGAGDAFLAGVLAVLVRGDATPGTASWKDAKTWIRALEIGHQLGAKAVSSVGATSGLVHLDDLRTRIGSGARTTTKTRASAGTKR